MRLDSERERTAAPGAPRWRACLELARARVRGRVAAWRAGRAQAALGDALAAAQAGDGCALADVRAAEARMAALVAAAATSLDEDRADWAAVPRWLRPAVVVRGVASRALLRHRLAAERAARRSACAALGASAVAGEGGAAAAPEVLVAAARAASAELARAQEAEACARTALDGTALPAVARHVGREAVELGKPLVQELRGRLLPRAPALAGLAVGWWIASTYTDSGFLATLHALGIGHGPRRRVDSGTLHAMQFWLPLVTAAACSYASGRIAALLRARYAPAPDRSPPDRP